MNTSIQGSSRSLPTPAEQPKAQPGPTIALRSANERGLFGTDDAWLTTIAKKRHHDDFEKWRQKMVPRAPTVCTLATHARRSLEVTRRSLIPAGAMSEAEFASTTPDESDIIMCGFVDRQRREINLHYLKESRYWETAFIVLVCAGIWFGCSAVYNHFDAVKTVYVRYALGVTAAAAQERQEAIKTQTATIKGAAQAILDAPTKHEKALTAVEAAKGFWARHKEKKAEAERQKRAASAGQEK